MDGLETIDAMPVWIVIVSLVLTIVGAVIGSQWNKAGLGVLLGALIGPLFFASALVWRALRGASL